MRQQLLKTLQSERRWLYLSGKLPRQQSGSGGRLLSGEDCTSATTFSRTSEHLIDESVKQALLCVFVALVVFRLGSFGTRN